MTEPSAAEEANIPIFSLEFTDKETLYRAYMPFVKGGALFVPTTQSFSLGDPVFLSLRILNEPKPYRLKGNVVWTMSQPSGTSKRGIGVNLVGEEGKGVHGKIELLLAGLLNSDKPTDTI